MTQTIYKAVRFLDSYIPGDDSTGAYDAATLDEFVARGQAERFVIGEPEAEAQPEPEPEPEKPKRRTRRKKAESED